jgi:hypothetical protein
MLRRVALVRTDVSEELSASFIRVTRMGELGTTLAVTSNRRTLSSSETTALTRATRRNIPEDTILHSHRRENLNSYKGNIVPVFNYSYESTAPWRRIGERSHSSTILQLKALCRRVLSFKPQTIHSWAEGSRHQIDRRLVSFQSLSAHSGENKPPFCAGKSSRIDTGSLINQLSYAGQL